MSTFMSEFDPQKSVELGDVILDYKKDSMVNIFGALPPSTAPSGSLDYVDLLKSLRMAVMAALAAGAVVVINSLSTSVLSFDFGPYSFLAVPLLTALFEAVRRFLVNYSQG